MEGGGSQLLPAASYCCIASHPWCLVQPPDAAAAPRQQHGGDIETGLMRPSTSQPHAVAAPVAAAAAFTTAAAVAAAATTSSSLSPETGRESSPAPAAASTAGGEGEGADISSLEELSFVRKVQQRQRQSLGARPTLGGLFASADSGGEDGAAAAVAQQQPEPSVAPALRTLDSPLSLRRPPSGSSLQTIAEGQQHLTPLHEHRPAAAAAAQLPSESAGAPHALYYSSLPAGTGSQLQTQLRRELAASRAAAGGSVDADAASTGDDVAEAAVAGPACAPIPPAAGAAPPRDSGDLYYSSVPAAMGRSMQAQLRQVLLVSGSGTTEGAQVPSVNSTTVAEAEPTAAEEEGAAIPSDEPGGYYSSLPAAMGRQLGAQLQQQLAAGAHTELAPSQQEPQERQESSVGVAAPVFEAGPGYYSSLPVAAGRTLLRELKEELAVSAGGVSSTSGVASGAGSRTVGLAEAEQASPQQSASPFSAAAASPEPDSPAASDSSAPPPAPALPAAAAAAAASHYSTMPAVVGRSLQLQLAQQLKLDQQGHAGSGQVQPDAPAAAPSGRFGLANRLFSRPPRPLPSASINPQLRQSGSSGA